MGSVTPRTITHHLAQILSHPPDAAQVGPVMMDFHGIWDGLRQGRPAPSRKDIQPERFRGHLGWLILLERAGADIRYRMVGSKVTEISGRDVTGRTMREIYGVADANAFIEQCDAVLSTWAPLYTRKSLISPGRDFITHAGLALPLSSDGVTADMILLRIEVTDRIGP